MKTATKSVTVPRTSGTLAELTQNYGPYLALAVALTAMLGSLYYSEIVGFIPCTLCWYQRVLMYPLNLIIIVGILKRDEYLPLYVLPMSVIGLLMSGYHYSLQLGLLPDTGCTIVSCSARYVNYFGFITIPAMALTAFILITVIMAAVKWSYSQLEPEA